MLRQFFEYARYLKPVMKLFIAALAAGALAAAASGFGFPLMIAKVFPVVFDNTQIPPELQNIIAHLGTQEFPRVRVGVGEKPPRMDLADYVLGHFSQGEGKIMEDAVKEAADAVMEAVEEGIDHAMNSHNRKKDGQA